MHPPSCAEHEALCRGRGCRVFPLPTPFPPRVEQTPSAVQSELPPIYEVARLGDPKGITSPLWLLLATLGFAAKDELGHRGPNDREYYGFRGFYFFFSLLSLSLSGVCQRGT